MPGAPTSAANAAAAPPGSPQGLGNTRFEAVQIAAAKWHVPVDVLWGVAGMESTFGSNPSTSSTGAQGPFQFEPETAKQYGLKNPQDFNASADAAAHYLHDLYNQHGHSWDAAVRGYGGGYGLADVLAKAKQGNQFMTANLGTTTGPIGAIGDAINTVTDPLSGIGDAVNAIADVMRATFQVAFNPQFYIRVGEAIVGALLIYEGLRGLSGVGPGITDVAAKAAGSAAKV